MDNTQKLKESSLECICCHAKKWRLIPNTDGGVYTHCSQCGYQIQANDKQQLKNEKFEEEQKKYYNDESICLTPLFVSLRPE